jgi:hypothetical protein
MDSERIPSHDIVPSGPATQPLSSPPRPFGRTPTSLSHTSTTSRFSLIMDVMTTFTCAECKKYQAGSRTLRFSRRDSFCHPMLCSCGHTVIQFGGPTSSPRSSTFRFKHDTTTTKQRSPLSQYHDISHAIGSALAQNAVVASSVASSQAQEGLGHKGVQTHDFHQTSGSLDTSAAPEKSNGYPRTGQVARGPAERRPAFKRKKPSLRRRGGAMHNLFHKLGMRIFVEEDQEEVHLPDVTKASTTAQDHGKRPVHRQTSFPPRISSVSAQYAKSDSSTLSPTTSHRCDCTQRCHCSKENIPPRYIRGGGEGGRSTHPDGFSGFLDGIVPENPWDTIRRRSESPWNTVKDRMSRLSRDSSMLSFTSCAGSGKQCTRYPPPQNPHHGAAGPSTLAPPTTHRVGSLHDSGVHMPNSRPSQSDDGDD